jgi:hypothetical protein
MWWKTSGAGEVGNENMSQEVWRLQMRLKGENMMGSRQRAAPQQ